MSLTPGTRLGPYEISAPIGVGGMGEVYRATDTDLARDVAIKVLPESVAADAERLARFDREARTLAALNHPNIAAIFGVERSEGRTALVMELVEGRTLAERIADGPVPLDEALAIAKGIAEALEAAHEKGIIHRDLKPANITVSADGMVKVLDFGLAKMIEPHGSAASMTSLSPTITSPATQLGIILGTAAYMSPEQAKGRPVDKRSDNWAFGCVLYEMLTGRRAFDGEDVTETLASVVKDRVDLTRVPAPARRLIAACLERDPRKRLRDIGDAWALLELDQPAAMGPPPAARSRSSMVAWIAAATAAVIAGTLAVIHLSETASEAPVLNATLLPPEGTNYDFNSSYAVPILSPDGSRIVFGARNAKSVVQLWIRRLDSSAGQPLPGTERAISPFWSADSRFVAFEQNQELKKIDIQGGPPVTITKVRNLRGGTWSRDGVILFATNGVDPIQRVSATGGTATAATTLEKGDTSGNRYPYFLPDQRHFLYTAPTGQPPFPVRVGSLDDPDSAGKVVATASSNAIYASGHIFFLRENTLMAQPFDAERLEAAGDAVPVAERVPTYASPSRMAGFDVSGSRLVYQSGGGETQSRLMWMDRSGKELTSIGDGVQFAMMQMSPDGSSLAVSSPDTSGRSDIWIIDVTRTGVRRRFTFDAAADTGATWSPDSATIIWRKNPGDLFRKRSNGTGVDELLFQDANSKMPLSVSPDGKVLLFNTPSPNLVSLDIWALPLDAATPQPRVVVDSPFADTEAQFHPDGRWIAYTSSESGAFEVYVTPYPGPGGKVQVSTGTGLYPHWRRDGKELFYVTQNGDLMAAEILMRDGALQVGGVERLFGGIITDRGYLYAPASDGQRFVVAQEMSPAGSPPLTLIQNWQALLKR